MSERTSRGVRVSHQPRVRISGGRLLELDMQGAITSNAPLVLAAYPDSWKVIGEIPASDAILEIAGLQDFDWFQFGLMRHAAELISLGYGESPEEVLSWFVNLRDADYIREGEYEIVGPERGPFHGLETSRLLVDDRWPSDDDVDDPRILSGQVKVGEGDTFEFEYPLDEVLGAFTIATVPR